MKNEDGEVIQRIPVELEDVLKPEDLQVYNNASSDSFILIDSVYLDLLKASRGVLIKDYDIIDEMAASHPILSEMFNGITAAEPVKADRSELRKLDEYKEAENYFVHDIDSTQHRAIDLASKSKAIVIQGPPGTGKSQTIVNLIAKNLADGKKILFVSEKRAALDVVFERMKSANISSQAVLIHSSDLNKTELYQACLELAESEPNIFDQENRQIASERLDECKSKINRYADLIQMVHEESGLTISDIILESGMLDRSLYDLELFRTYRKISYRNAIDLAGSIAAVTPKFLELRKFEKSNWAYRKSGIIRTLELEAVLLKSVNDFQVMLRRKLELKDKIQSSLPPEMGTQNLDYILNVETPRGGGSELDRLTFLIGSFSFEVLERLSRYIADQRKILEDNHRYSTQIKAGAPASEVQEMIDYARHKHGVFAIFTKAFWKNRRLNKMYCINNDKSFDFFEGYANFKTSFGKLSEILSKFTSTQTSDVSYDQLLNQTGKMLGEINALTHFFSECENIPFIGSKLKFDSTAALNDFIRKIENIKVWNAELSSLNSQALVVWSEGTSYLTKVPSFDFTDENLKFLISLHSDLEALSLFDAVQIEVENIESKHPSFCSNFYHKLLEGGRDWSETLKSSVIFGWMDTISSAHPEVRSFVSEEHEKGIDRYRFEIPAHTVTSRNAVHQAFAQRWVESGNRTGLALLRRESAKQRRVMSPREIMEKGALETMMQLKPCWLMSPLSISQMIPMESGLFDVIIFDEASQVRVEEAIPSIYRAKTMIVVGDSKQMPPTNFFGPSVDEDSDEDEEDGELSPSVLDLAVQVYPSVLLEWHYRSRSEALIAFSNRAYYGGRLIAAPDPLSISASNAIKHVQLTNAYYESRFGNRREAEAVVDKLIELLKADATISYGVIAMGQKQAGAIEEAVEARCLRDKEAQKLVEISRNFKSDGSEAGFFVKNLENVQGDERDVILLSVGYAAPAEGKKVRMNFGPLSSKGGGRRLNVAITRARSRMYVFTSFAPQEIAIDDASFQRNPDLCVFGRYLNFVSAVHNDRQEQVQNILDSFGMGGAITSMKSSRFALDVKRRLEEKGYEVSAEIGSSGFYIDLGVHHPTMPSRFVLGIECDGAVFHSTPYAKDRDSIRQKLLERRGWRIARVWSQDWSKNWQREVERIQKILESLISD